jgi:hypothetical protein
MRRLQNPLAPFIAMAGRVPLESTVDTSERWLLPRQRSASVENSKTKVLDQDSLEEFCELLGWMHSRVTWRAAFHA